jgi:DNA helicase II / ATP-dependent DNA helicase PcrA
MTNFLKHLNSFQQKAAGHTEGPLLVVAGAGSGKTRTLTYRIANLLLNHQVEPEQILAVTFTNKAAKEMNERVEALLVQELSQPELGMPLSELSELQLRKLRSKVRKKYIKSYANDGLWVGTFHSMCCRILRLDIEKYVDRKGRKWQKNFSIYDDSDTQALVKEIAIKQLNLDEKKYEPRSLRFAISNAKNKGWSPNDLELNEPTLRGRTIAKVYEVYQDRLAANNALDFDDLLFIPVRLFEQNFEVLSYWHERFKHILVDEYQDTNRTQYDLIRLLTTNNAPPKWDKRSVFVVGDADQSIYSFRAADFTILMEFQQAFGDRLPDAHTQTMIKLEENYRSVANILTAANQLIENNSQRIDKVLRATRADGDLIKLFRADDEIEEAQYVIDQIRTVQNHVPDCHWGHFAILYRTNAQSRVFEDVLVRLSIPHKVVGGQRFYDRKEIKDLLAYLRLLANTSDNVSLMRIINVPRRGIGAATIDRINEAAQALSVPVWEILDDDTTAKTLAGRSSKGVLAFAELIKKWRSLISVKTSAEIIEGIMVESGYIAELQEQGTDEASDRLSNLKELYNAALQFAEENEDASLEGFLASAALSSSLDESAEEENKVTLMTLHGAKGLEFPVVFLVGLEQGLFPSFRSLNDPMSLEEERRLMYVGITRAQEQLYLCHAHARRLYGNRESAVPSQFLSEIPKDLLHGKGSDKLPTYKRETVGSSKASLKATFTPAVRSRVVVNWKVGDRVRHDKFGDGKVTNLLGEGNKMFLAVAFPGQGKKILDPKLAPIERI